MFLITKDQRKCHLKVKASSNGIRHNIKPFIRQTTKSYKSYIQKSKALFKLN